MQLYEFRISLTKFILNTYIYIYININEYICNIYKLVKITYIVIANYCLTASAPSLLNGIATNFNTTVNSSSNYKCSNGYFGSPYIICNPFSSTNGQWSSINGNCTGKIRLVIK